MLTRSPTTATRLISIPRAAPHLAAAAAELRRALQSLAAQGARGPCLLRLEQRLADGVDPLAWLAAQAPAAGEDGDAARFYWADRDRAIETAGMGLAVRHDAATFAHLPWPMAGDGALRWIVTARFRPGAPAAAGDEWAAFGTVRAYLPRLEVRREGARCTLACHLQLDGGGSNAGLEAAARALARLRPVPAAGTEPRAVCLLPGQAAPGQAAGPDTAWTASVASVLADIRAARLHKAVLARREMHRAAEPVCGIAVLQRLALRQPGTFLFCVQPSGSAAFVGASPELLYRRRGDAVESEAVAGTRPRDPDPERDAALGRELLAGDKEWREHECVRAHVRAVLGAHCRELTEGDTDLVRLDNVQHRRTAFRGRLLAGVTDAQVLASLHPTPAVCGWPPAPAFARIDACERFDRGLYGGAIGCFGADAVDCAVAIRCGLVGSDGLRLYAGAGIVEGSDAEAEWRETESKLRAFAAVLEAARS